MLSPTEKLPTYAEASATTPQFRCHLTIQLDFEQPPTTTSGDSPACDSTGSEPVPEAAILQPVANAASGSSTPAYSTQVNVAEHTKSFHVFKTFPTEIRLKIWGHAASVQRVIELDNITDRQRPDLPADADEDQLMWRPEMMEHSYEVIRASPNSRQPPAILHVNRESRTESLKFYQLTRFERRFPPRHSIYYNPTVDIVYFGEQSDLVTLNNVFRSRLEIPNVAIVHGDESVTSMHPAPQHPFTVLQILHGLDPKSEVVHRFSDDDSDIRSSDWPGCKGLKTVIFVLPSGIRPTGGNAAPLHFQTANSSELSDHFGKEEAICDQNRERVRSSTAIAGYPPPQTSAPAPVWDPRFPSESEIRNLNQGVELESFPNWTGDAKPTFYFASLGTVPLVEKIYHTITIPATIATKKALEYKNYHLTREIKAETGCSIKIGPEAGFVPPELDEQGRMVVAASAFTPTREIRFFGSRAQIWKAEQCFRRELGSKNREGENGGQKIEPRLESWQAWMAVRRKM